MLHKTLHRVFPIAVATALTACGGGSPAGGPSSQIPAIANSATPTLTSQATTVSSPYYSAILNDHPIAFYPLDNAAPTAYDLSGNGLNGAIGSSLVTGASGLAGSTQATSFPGVQSAAGAVSVPQSSKLQPTSAVSLEALFRFGTIPSSYTVLAADGMRSGNASYELFFENGHLMAQFAVGSGVVVLQSPSTLSANSIYDAVATFNGSTARLYLNGSLIASGSKSGTISYISGWGFSLGDDAMHSNPAFKGTIGGVAVFGSALSSTQVSAHFAAVSASSTTTPAPTPTASPKPTASPAPIATASPSGTIVWKAGDAALGKWIVANTYQCGSPVNSGTTFTFNLVQNGTNCGRNQAMPLNPSGSAFTLVDGATYTWTFRYIDGKPDGSGPGMGLDTGPDPEANLWQIHGSVESDSPCTGLDFENGSYFSNSLGAGQQWAFTTCKGYVWFGKYTPGEIDDFKIVATIANADITSETYGETKLYRNGVLVLDDHGPNYHHSASSPPQSWWNFGIYKWRWELSGGGGSKMTNVNATFDNLTLTRQ